MILTTRERSDLRFRTRPKVLGELGGVFAIDDAVSREASKTRRETCVFAAGLYDVESQTTTDRRSTTMAEQKVGVVSHYFGKLSVAAVELTDGELRVGDTIHVKGHTSDFTQTVDSIQIEHDKVESAKAGESIGIRVAEHAREHDEVFRVTPD